MKHQNITEYFEILLVTHQTDKFKILKFVSAAWAQLQYSNYRIVCRSPLSF